MARLYADEDFPLPVVEELRRLGHDVRTVQDADLKPICFPGSPVLYSAARTKPDRRRSTVMGYETALHLIDVRIKDASVPIVKKALETKKGRGLRPISSFLEEAFLGDDRFLCFKSTGEYDEPYLSDEEDETVTVLNGKWYEAEQIAEWLKLHCEKAGRLIQHSCEADGAAWGWEFNGRGKLRELALCSVGKWR
jgi:hypothetical protein